jgi:pyruvate ferredoxin oxidoreductase delta subunit
VVSLQDSDSLLHAIHAKQQPYKLGVLKGVASFSGMWVYKDDHTDVRVLGAIAKALPQLFGLPSLEKYIQEKLKNDLKVTSARVAFEKFSTIEVQPGVGNPEEPFHFDMPGWQTLRAGVSINGLAERGGAYADPVTGQVGGFRPSRNDKFKKYTTRTMRPVVNFETCTKCTLCWLNCPDASFDVTPDGTYDANLEACCGCGICEAVCPVPNCITMVSETAFQDNASQWEAFRKDKAGYQVWLKTVVKAEGKRAHGFRYRGQYKEEIPAALELAKG